jgi:hypothetical protein
MVPSIGRNVTVVGPEAAQSARVLTPEAEIRSTGARWDDAAGCSTSSYWTTFKNS